MDIRPVVLLNQYFDGYFIFKGLLELPDIDINKVNSIIDDLHRFINIDIT
jgi:hypothetical protein